MLWGILAGLMVLWVFMFFLYPIGWIINIFLTAVIGLMFIFLISYKKAPTP